MNFYTIDFMGLQQGWVLYGQAFLLLLFTHKYKYVGDKSICQ